MTCIQNLLRICELADIKYVVWKNVSEINFAISNNNDLDLYVNLCQKNAFESILRDNGFIQFKSAINNYPYICHYYKTEGAKFAHLHVYYKLVTGDSWLKEYIIPEASELFDGKTKYTGFNVYTPSKSYLLWMFLLRRNLKCSTLIGLILYLLQYKSYDNELNSILRMQGQVNYNLMPSSPKLANKTISSAPVSFIEGLIQRILCIPYRRFSLIGFTVFRFLQFLKRLRNKILCLPGKLLVGGGVVIAITGPDASGKTSSINYLSSKYKKVLNVKRIHMGKVSFPLFSVFKLRSSPSKYFYGDSQKSENSFKKSLSGTFSLIKAIYIASVRLFRAHKAVYFAQKGYLVICDRWPSSVVGTPDGPRYHDSYFRSPLLKFLVKIESTIYNYIPLADLSLRLTASLDAVKKRNSARIKDGKETDQEITDRFYKSQSLHPISNMIIDIENDNINLDELFLSIDNQVWNYLRSIS